MLMFSTLLVNVVIFALLLVPGYIMGRRGMIERVALGSMTNILMYVAMPALVLNKLLLIDVRALSLTDILVCVVSPVAAVAIAFGFAALMFRRCEGDTRPRVARFCAVFSNCGFLGIPLADVLFPDRPEVALAVSLFNVISTFLLLTFGVYILSDDRKHICLRRACISPIAIAIVAGALLSLTGVGVRVPEIGCYTGYLAALTTPLSMLVLGVELSSMRVGDMLRCRALYLCSLVKLVLVPCTVILLLGALCACGLGLGEAARTGIFLATAVSTAASAPAMAKKYGADGRHAAMLTLGTTLLCVLTLPLLYGALCAVGLL